MPLSRLDPQQDYSKQSEITFYHGINAYQLEDILDRGSTISKRRRKSEGYEFMVAHLHEDIIRHAGQDIANISLSNGEHVRAYMEEHRDALAEQGSDYTQWITEEENPLLERGINFIDSVVWLSRDKHEAQNHSAKRKIAGCDSTSGGYFEFSIPESGALELGLNGVVPGEVPLEFADALYLENMDQNAREDIWLEFISKEYDVDMKQA